MFAKYELAVLYEALNDLRPETCALVQDELPVSVSELRVKVKRLINEGADEVDGSTNE
ncbi:hypothetical protein P9E81_08620 [Bacillus licheniformis]|uniref:hypothetical protein n=1 Tax=Bacillus licheniformis TaxID=1402 RepID=UPI0015C90697|nr:hypothetical protein [Bacillus licheniformis]MCQ5303195.1 hypothetical protein [Bacillus licheniformis]MEC0777445.1 hypothetical protein [Bacillus licheniformis]MEC1851478.1 hypothetical protein [Bacillus licheniformis]